MHKCQNNSVGNVYHLEQMVDQFFPYSQKQLGFDKPATITFQSDDQNASKMLGKTAYYDPSALEVVLYTDNRHPKDILRSLSHELVHHAQNCRGDFTGDSATYEGYAQSDPHLRKMEREAYTKGNLIFRDFEDLIKTGKINIEIDFSDSGEPKMSLKEWKNNEINTKLMKKWGLLKEGAKPDFLDLDKDGDKEESMKSASENLKEDERELDTRTRHLNRTKDGKLVPAERDPEHPDAYKGGLAWSKEHGDEEGNRPSMAKKMDLDEEQAIFAPNHYCVHHGGVQHEGQIKMAEAINHNFDRKLNKVTWYDMKLQDGTILEQVAASDIQVTNASLGEGHSHSMRDEDEEEIEEGVFGFKSADEKRKELATRPDFTAGGTKEDDPGVDPPMAHALEKAQTAKRPAAKRSKSGAGDRMRARRGARGGGSAAGSTNIFSMSETSGKISVREAKQITRRIIERIRKETN
jgi:hypothetical protein